MVEPLELRNLAWALTTVTELVLLCYLLRRKLYLSHKALAAYVVATILQSVAVFAAHRLAGTQSVSADRFAWGTQAVIICARWAAVVELARKLLGPYSGIWSLAKRILMSVSVCVLAYSLLFSRGRWYTVVMNADRGIELSAAAFIVTLLLFARFYALPEKPLEKSLLIGFCLYSCFCVINYSLFNEWQSYTVLWNFLDILTYLASVLLWINAVSIYSPLQADEPRPTVSEELYGKVSTELNLRLLNEQLDHLLRSGDQRS